MATMLTGVFDVLRHSIAAMLHRRIAVRPSLVARNVVIGASGQSENSLHALSLTGMNVVFAQANSSEHHFFRSVSSMDRKARVTAELVVRRF